MSEPVDFCKKRMKHLRGLMETENIDVLYIIRSGVFAFASAYKKLTDSYAGNAIVIPRDGDATLLCNPTDFEEAKDESWIRVREIEDRGKIDEYVADYVEEHLGSNGSKFGVSLSGRSSLSYSSYEYFKGRLKTEFVDITPNILSKVFCGLYPGEVKYQRKVSRLADIAVAAARESLVPGMTEIEVAAEANYAMMRRGAEMQSFPTIISSGERAGLCHGWPGERKLKRGDLVIIDLGPLKDGYAADESRTYLVGGGDEKKHRMLTALDKSVQAVLDRVKPGVKCKDLDLISRQVLEEHGFPDYPHTLGHTLSGFLVPTLSKTSEQILEEGMVFTIEPGIYLPNYGGVRFEENVVVTEDGCELLTKNPRI